MDLREKKLFLGERGSAWPLLNITSCVNTIWPCSWYVILASPCWVGSEKNKSGDQGTEEQCNHDDTQWVSWQNEFTFAECELQVYLILSKGHLVEKNIKNSNRQKLPMKTGSSAQNLDHFMFLYQRILKLRPSGIVTFWMQCRSLQDFLIVYSGINTFLSVTHLNKVLNRVWLKLPLR